MCIEEGTIQSRKLEFRSLQLCSASMAKLRQSVLKCRLWESPRTLSKLPVQCKLKQKRQGALENGFPELLELVSFRRWENEPFVGEGGSLLQVIFFFSDEYTI